MRLRLARQPTGVPGVLHAPTAGGGAAGADDYSRSLKNSAAASQSTVSSGFLPVFS